MLSLSSSSFMVHPARTFGKMKRGVNHEISHRVIHFGVAPSTGCCAGWVVAN